MVHHDSKSDLPLNSGRKINIDFISTAAAASYHDPKSMPEAKPEIKKAEFVISGGPSIKQCEILNDKRHILTKDTENNVSLYDVLKARKVEDLGQVEFEQEVKKRLQVSFHEKNCKTSDMIYTEQYDFAPL